MATMSDCQMVVKVHAGGDTVLFTVMVTVMGHVLAMRVRRSFAEILTSRDAAGLSIMITEMILFLVMTIMISNVSVIVVTAGMAIISSSVVASWRSISTEVGVGAVMTSMGTVSLALLQSVAIRSSMMTTISISSVMTTISISAITMSAVTISHSVPLTIDKTFRIFSLVRVALNDIWFWGDHLRVGIDCNNSLRVQSSCYACNLGCLMKFSLRSVVMIIVVFHILATILAIAVVRDLVCGL